MVKSPKFPEVKVLEIGSISDLPSRLLRKHKYLTLLLAWDAPTSDLNEQPIHLQKIVENGLVYFCAWGQNCSAVHDAVDLMTVVRDFETGEDGVLVMTTWHEDEPLQEAVWFFKKLALPSDNEILADCDRYAVAVGNPAWAKLMREALAVVS